MGREDKLETVGKAEAKSKPKEEKAETIYCKFNNLEDSGQPLSFNHEGRKFGPWLDGQCYDVPMDTFKHINSLAVPITKLEDVKAPDGTIVGQKHVPAGSKNRFALIPQ